MLLRQGLGLLILSLFFLGLLRLGEAGEAERLLSPSGEPSEASLPAILPVPVEDFETEPPPVSDRIQVNLPGAPAIEPEPATLPGYPLEVNPAVERFVERFQSSSKREVVGRWLDRSTRYLEMIRQVFRDKGLPEDLAFTAMVESGFNPLAVSRAGAKGLWQFMEPPARRYGLRVDRWVDERLDPEKSTHAAADYLKDLFAQFGHWFLAQAAYNAGEVKVARAVERARGGDFWTIARGRWLREETKQFVPQIQAAALIARAPERYGFQVSPEEPVVYEVVSAPLSIDLKHLAQAAGLAPEALRDLNPELRRGVTPPGGPYALKVPAGGAGAVAGALERWSIQRAQAKLSKVRTVTAAGSHRGAAHVHVVQPRDTLSDIAKRYGVSVTELVRLNGLDSEARIYPGDQIRLAVSVLPSEREPAW